MTGGRPRRGTGRSAPPAGSPSRRRPPGRRPSENSERTAGGEPEDIRFGQPQRGRRGRGRPQQPPGRRTPAAQEPPPAPGGSPLSALRSHWPGTGEHDVVVVADNPDGDNPDRPFYGPPEPRSESGTRGGRRRARGRARGRARAERQRPPRAPVGGWLKAHWPGQPVGDGSGAGAASPADVDGGRPGLGGDAVVDAEADAPDPKPVLRSGARQVAPTRPEERVLVPVSQRAAVTGDEDEEQEAARPRLTAVKEPRKLPLFGLRQLRAVVTAVYAALADPLNSDDERVREIRAARLRRAGIVAGSTVLAVLLVYAIFPVREFLDHREARNRQTERRDVLLEANESQQEYLEYLQSDEGIEDLAREHGFTYPGEEPLNVLPAPEDDDGSD